MYKVLLLFSFLLCSGAGAQSLTHGVELRTMEGRNYTVDLGKGLNVVVFLSPTCPLSQKYTRTLNELAKEFKGKVKFYGVFADSDSISDEHKEFRKKYELQFALFLDRRKQLVKSLHATVTPESFVIRNGVLVYQGAIDDWAIELGKTKKKAGANFLKNGIQSALSQTAAVPHFVKPVGCFIE